MTSTSFYERRYTYSQVKAICEIAKYGFDWDYETIIRTALNYASEWQKLAKIKESGSNKIVYNEIGNPLEPLTEEEYAYEQAYYDRRIREDYLM